MSTFNGIINVSLSIIKAIEFEEENKFSLPSALRVHNKTCSNTFDIIIIFNLLIENL